MNRYRIEYYRLRKQWLEFLKEEQEEWKKARELFPRNYASDTAKEIIDIYDKRRAHMEKVTMFIIRKYPLLWPYKYSNSSDINLSSLKKRFNKLYFKFVFAKDLSPSVSGYAEGLSKQ